MSEALLALCVYAAGMVLMAAGAWLVEPAAGLIVAGAGLIFVAMLYVRGRSRG